MSVICNIFVKYLQTILPGGLLSPISYVDVPADLENLTFSIPPISISFSKEKHPILSKLGAFFIRICQNTSNLCNLGSFIADENPLDRYTKFREKAPQKAGTYTSRRKSRIGHKKCNVWLNEKKSHQFRNIITQLL